MQSIPSSRTLAYTHDTNEDKCSDDKHEMQMFKTEFVASEPEALASAVDVDAAIDFKLRTDQTNTYMFARTDVARIQDLYEPEATPVVFATASSSSYSDHSKTKNDDQANRCAWRTAHTIARLFKRIKIANETFVEFANGLRAIASNCYIGEELMVTAFVAGINDEMTAALLRVVAPQTLSAAVHEAARLRDSDGTQLRLAQAATRCCGSSCAKKRPRETDSNSFALRQPACATMSTVTQQQLPRKHIKSARIVQAVPAAAVPSARSSTSSSKIVANGEVSHPNKRRRAVCFACAEVGHYRRECTRQVKLL